MSGEQQKITDTPAKKSPPKKARTIRLAQNIQLHVKGDTVLLRAGDTVQVGRGPYDVDPAWLERQPLLDLDHQRNRDSMTARRAVLDKITAAQRDATKRGREAVRRIGNRERRLADVGIV